jgi:hypothetical protein
MAAFAMAGVLHSLFVNEMVDVLEVPGGTEAVGMDGLAPLVIGLLVAVAAVFGGVEALGAYELAGGTGGVGGQKRGLFAEGVVVVGGGGRVELGGGAGDSDS